MATIIPCIKAKMGDNDYFLAKLSARELTAIARPAKETDQWASQHLEERLQRELNEKRIKNEIAPYLATQSDRLFGAVVVLLQGVDTDFESIADVAKGLPKAYQNASSSHGFLSIEGGELIMLDGQHRFGALREVIQGGTNGDFASEVANDDISVIFLPEVTTQRTRHIFNRINRYAKPTGRGDNIITSEDDGYAIVARRLLEVGHGPLGVQTKEGKLIVNWKSNTVAERSIHLTTISAVYETIKDILKSEKDADFSIKSAALRPTDEELERGFVIADKWWSKVLADVPVYAEAVEKPELLPKLREQGQPGALLLKPVTQIALFRGLVKAVTRGKDLSDLTPKIKDIDFSFDNELWDQVLVTGGSKMLHKKENQDMASDVIAYLLAKETTSSTIKKALEEKLQEAKNDEGFMLP